MRGQDEQQTVMYSYLNLEDRIAADHPLRRIRAVMEVALQDLWAHFAALYSHYGRPSIPPERLLRALLLQILYGLRSERQLMERLNYDLLFRWFVGLNPDDPIWDVSVFTKNRERLMKGAVSQRLLEAIVRQAGENGLLSEEHFTVDGTLIQAWAGRQSFVPKDPPPRQGTGSGGKIVLRDQVESKTDREARLYKKSAASESRPSYLGHVLIENRNGLVVAGRAPPSRPTAEREAALAMLDVRGRRPGTITEQTKAITLGADRLYQEEKFITGLRQRKVLPHVAEYQPNQQWSNWLTEEERNHPGFSISQKKRRRVEKIFGWGKGDSILRQMKLHGVGKVDWLFRLLITAFDLVRMVKLIPRGKLIPAV